MTYRLTSPTLQFLDQYGNPLSGGQLFFFQSGTTTPQPVYADQGLLTPLSNPIVLDSTGSTVAPYLSSGQAYKVELTDANGVVLWTVDPVTDPAALGASITGALSMSGVAGTTRDILFQTAGLNRFALGIDNTAETGNNSGSNFFLSAYNDNGTFLDKLFSVNRQTGVVDFYAVPTIAGNGFIPTGAVMPFAMESAPSGWLFCDGSAISRANYPTLFQTIGTTYGAGDGSTTFNLPNYQGMFLRGFDVAGTVDTTGRTFGSTQADQLQTHSHLYSESYNNFGAQGGGSNGVSGATGGAPTAAPTNYTFTGTTTVGSNTMTGVSSVTGLAVGQKLYSANIPINTTITAVGTTTITMSNPATATGTGTVTSLASIGTETRPVNVAVYYCIKD